MPKCTFNHYLYTESAFTMRNKTATMSSHRRKTRHRRTESQLIGRPMVPPIVSSTATVPPATAISTITDEKASRIVAKNVVMAARHVGFTIIEIVVAAMIFGTVVVTAFVPILAGLVSADGILIALCTALIVPLTDNWLKYRNMRVWRYVIIGHAVFLAVYLVFVIVHAIAFSLAPAWVDPTAYVFFLLIVLEIGGVLIMDIIVVFVLIPMLVNASRAYAATSDAANARLRQAEAYHVATAYRGVWLPKTVRQ